MNKSSLLEIYKADTSDALKTLIHSWEKLKSKNLPEMSPKNLDDFEPWEALASRFARTTDLFLSKYIRILVLQADPGFRGEMRDFLDKAEKSNSISDADRWMSIRELRNKIAHEYTKQDIIKTLNDIVRFTPFVIDELKRLNV